MVIHGEQSAMAKIVNAEVKARRGESIERMIRRFIKTVKKEGILEEYREKMYYEKPSDRKRKIKSRQQRIAEKKNIEKKQLEKKLERGR